MVALCSLNLWAITHETRRIRLETSDHLIEMNANLRSKENDAWRNR
jgi:hypothetical protein